MSQLIQRQLHQARLNGKANLILLLNVTAFSLLCTSPPHSSSKYPYLTIHGAMEQQPKPREQPSQIPDHLQHLHKATASPRIHRSHPTIVKSIEPTDFAIRHRSFPAKRTLQETLKDIILKDWQGKHRRLSTSTKRISAKDKDENRKRPTNMRMRDSDDYITARGANPRTGLISPSPEFSTPRRLWTPETPEEALRLLKWPEGESPSSGFGVKVRPPFQRANEGRKVSPDCGKQLRLDSGVTIASPRIMGIKADAGLISSKSQPSLISEDQFVVRMPSAREPQPYAYPGCSAKQIQAFEQHKDPMVKTQKRSSGAFSSKGPEISIPKQRGDLHERRNHLSDPHSCIASGVDSASFSLLSSTSLPAMATHGRAFTAAGLSPDNISRVVRRKGVPGADHQWSPSREPRPSNSSRRSSLPSSSPKSHQPREP